jgi:hypothetical protein
MTAIAATVSTDAAISRHASRRVKLVVGSADRESMAALGPQ